MKSICVCILMVWQLGPLFSGVAFRTISLEEGLIQAQREQKPIFIYFSANWCMPCEWMEKNTFSDTNNSRIINNHFVPIKFDVDDPLCKGLVEKFEVKSLPTIIFLDINGELTMKLESSMGPEEMFLTCRKVLGDHLEGRKLEDLVISTPTYSVESDQLPPSIPESVSIAHANRPNYAPESIGGYSLEHLPPSPPTIEDEDFATPRSVETYVLVLGRYSELAAAVKNINRLEKLLAWEIKLVRRRKESEIRYHLKAGLFTSYEEAKKNLDLLKIKGVKGWVKKQ